SKEETERLKRKGLNLEKEQVKKQKSSEEVPEIETTTKEFTEEKIKEMMQEDLNQLWALVKEYLSIRPASKWKLYDLSGVHHVTVKDKEIFMLVERDYPLRRGLALVMISYKLQVEDYSQMAEDLIRKIYNIANTLKKQISNKIKAQWSFKRNVPAMMLSGFAPAFPTAYTLAGALLTFSIGPVGNKMHKVFPLLEESSHWKYNFPLPVEDVPTARRMEIPLLKSLHCYRNCQSKRIGS
nr:hypothetical protein [Tanacetum cinerariifolium]